MKLSVIVPCHNAARFLPTTFASIQQNTTADSEWIFVDDGSTDATAAMLRDFRPVWGRALVLTNPLAQGASRARNHGTDRAEGRFISYLDADDWYAPGYLPRLTDAIEQLGVDFVRTDHVQSEGRMRTTRRAPESRRWVPLPANDGIDAGAGCASMVEYPNAWSAIYDRRLVDAGLLRFDPTLLTAEDRLMSWRLHLHAESFAVVGLLGYFYRRAVRGSLTAIGDDRQLHFFDAYDRIGAELGGGDDTERFRPHLVRNYLALMAHHEMQRRRLRRDVYRQFHRRARATLRSLPAALVDDALTTMELTQARIIRRLQ